MLALPFGIDVAAKQEAPGFATSAPTNPNIGRKFIIATIMAAVMWAITFALLHYKILSLPELT